MDFGPASIIISGDCSIIYSFNSFGYWAFEFCRIFFPPESISNSFRNVPGPTAYKSRAGLLLSPSNNKTFFLDLPATLFFKIFIFSFNDKTSLSPLSWQLSALPKRFIDLKISEIVSTLIENVGIPSLAKFFSNFTLSDWRIIRSGERETIVSMSGFSTPPILGRMQASFGYMQKSVTATMRSLRPNSKSISVIDGEVEIIRCVWVKSFALA